MARPLPTSPLFVTRRRDTISLPARIRTCSQTAWLPTWCRRSIGAGEEPWSPRLADKCEITIWLKGYQQERPGRLHDGAVIVLKQLGDPEGSTVSVTALHVPKDAAKAYDKGIAAIGRWKLPAAQKQFERAAELYPGYAQAWSRSARFWSSSRKLKEAVGSL